MCPPLSPLRYRPPQWCRSCVAGPRCLTELPWPTRSASSSSRIASPPSSPPIGTWTRTRTSCLSLGLLQRRRAAVPDCAKAASALGRHAGLAARWSCPECALQHYNPTRGTCGRPGRRGRNLALPRGPGSWATPGPTGLACGSGGGQGRWRGQCPSGMQHWAAETHLGHEARLADARHPADIDGQVGLNMQSSRGRLEHMHLQQNMLLLYDSLSSTASCSHFQSPRMWQSMNL